ncbi:MAG: histidine phosphatase family protein [Gammaproteobacteria bacterium]|jgi:phosphohistidine phosphatase|nr:histidine phosphatase family protein [Gammaproteobacteria bacterium]MBT3725831.1 histidine phosphatase family protein [Gammaproteobacteria bacterium]MBT4078189.1 histidine phosphatase family protein [Gammaproteobacteria bacterium]MBT4195710.1 histidine phosphatase family protein [Gammaproteobacteria bacterium]MBT4450787.1 histidine phosphatase family protein [Gammaproteobacteria bacterium]
MKTLYLVRHAKSSWKDKSLSDIQRPLNKRGFRSAPDMGERLKKADVEIDLIVSSPAIRAITTATILADAIGYDSRYITQDDRLYFEGQVSMFDIIRKTKSHYKSLMIVGHNPDMTSLLNKLCGYQTVNMPTCAIARIQFDMAWSEVIDHCGNLQSYDFPKKIHSK